MGVRGGAAGEVLQGWSAWGGGRAGGHPGGEPAGDRRRAAAEVQVSSRSGSPERRPEPGLVLMSRGARLGVAGRLTGMRLAGLRGSMAPLSVGCAEDVAEMATEGDGWVSGNREGQEGGAEARGGERRLLARS